LTWLTW